MNSILKLIPLTLITVLFNCGDAKTEDNTSIIKLKNNSEQTKQNTSDQDDQTALIEQGKKLFNSNACTGCHMPNTTAIGPSIKEITAIYTKQDGDYIAFLKGETDPIMDQDPGQILVMKANLDTYVKKLSGTQLKAIVAYMKSID